RRAEADFSFFRRGPDEPATLEALGEQAGPLGIPPDDLQKIAPALPEHEQVAGIRILGQDLFSLRRQCVEATPHVRHAGREPHPRIARHRDHAIRPCTSPTTDDSAVDPSTTTRRPSDSVMSTRCARRVADVAPAVLRLASLATWSMGGSDTSN